MQSQRHSAGKEFPFDEKHFRFLSELAQKKTGIMLPPHKRDMVYGRLARRLRALNLENFTQYCELLQSPAGEEEVTHLVNAITTNLTSFFREAHHFEHLGSEALAPWVKGGAGGKRLRMWSSACSSGMEPYSMAMMLKSVIPDAEKRDIRILATDIDSNMLSVASAGEYPSTDLENIANPYRKYIQRSTQPNLARISDELRGLIAFRQLNLLEAWPMRGTFDVIFCRNVVIYFDKPTKQKLFDRMADMMVPGGWLYIGHSENLHGVSDRFELVGRTIYRRVG